jgi:chromosome segregation ATPase
MEDRNIQLLTYEKEMSNILEALKLLTVEVGSYKNASKNLDAAYQTLQSLTNQLVENLEAINSLQNEVKNLTTTELFNRLESIEKEIENNTTSASSAEEQIQKIEGEVEKSNAKLDQIKNNLQTEIQKQIFQSGSEIIENESRISKYLHDIISSYHEKNMSNDRLYRRYFSILLVGVIVNSIIGIAVLIMK